MKINRSLIKLACVLPLYIMNTGCSSDDAHATSPCPGSINSSEVIVLDSISGNEITTADVIFSGNTFDPATKEYGVSETIFNYDSERKSYGFSYFNNDTDFEIEKDSITIYTIDESYNYNVTKPKIYGCTGLEVTIYLCPNGTACR